MKQILNLNTESGFLKQASMHSCQYLFFIFWLTAFYNPCSYAQGTSITAIQIGEKVPDITITNIQNYKSNIAKISDFKGKLLILDFWATWCSPCVAMIPKMDSLQKVFDGKVQFLPVAYEKAEIVNPFLEKVHKNHPFNLPEVVDDKVLIKMFPHSYLPHYVWIDDNGFVVAITGLEEVNSATILSFLKGQTINVPAKIDIIKKFDNTKPFLSNNNGGDGSNLIYHSAFSGYIEGYSGTGYFGPVTSKGRKYVMINNSIPNFYKHAYGLGTTKFLNRNRLIIDVKEPNKLIYGGASGKPALEWMRQGNAFCYELYVPPTLTNRFFDIMQEDLRRFFPQYQAKVEVRTVTCMVLIRTSNEDKLRTRDTTTKAEVVFNSFGGRLRNTYLNNFFVQIQIYYQQLSPTPFINETGYLGKVDLDINAKLSDVNAMNTELEKYGLKFVEQQKEIEMLVIRDAVIADH